MRLVHPPEREIAGYQSHCDYGNSATMIAYGSPDGGWTV